jgi:N-acetylglucosaminyldiphosphoundecaprenol N-acetyl-beta-D-mannosaminyltransferase
MKMTTVREQALLGVRVGGCSLSRLLDDAMGAVNAARPAFTFACANPHSLVTAQIDTGFRAALQACSVVVADGIGVTVAGRMARIDVGPRITGTDFFLGLMSRLNHRGGRVMFFGSRDTVLERILARCRREFPNLHVDVLSPPYGEWSDPENRQMLQRIELARPDVLWVGMTAPRQEKWVYRNAAQLHVSVIGSIGAVFDFYAGTVVRAPDWACRAGLEWLYRLLREPQRLWRRSIISAPAFLWLVLREHVLLPRGD